MSRITGDFEAAGDASSDVIELLTAFASSGVSEESRRSAMACFLSGGAGWKKAAETLSGAFASPANDPTGLTPGKDQ